MLPTTGFPVFLRPRAAGATTDQPRRVRPGGLRMPRDPYRVTLFLLTLLTISRVHQVLPLVGRLRPALVLFAIAAAFALLRPRVLAGTRALRPWPAKALAALGVVACLSVPFGISLGRAATFVLDHYVQVFIYAFLVILAFRDVSDLRMFVWAYVASLGFLVWQALFVFTPKMAEDGTMRLGDMYTYDSNDLGTILALGLPLCLLTLHVSGVRGRVFSGMVALGIGAALARTGSRGAFVGFLAVGVGLLLLANTVPLAKRVAFAAAALAAMAVAAPPGYWDRMETLKSPTEDYNWDSQNGRRQVAIRGMGYMLRYPVFGIGVNNFPMAEGTISPKAETHVAGTGIRWTAAHNSHVQIAAEMGVMGLVIWTALMLGGVIVPLRLRRRMPRAWARGAPDERFLYFTATYLPLAFLGFIVAGAFVSFAYLSPAYLLISLLVGLQVCVDQKLRIMAPGVRGARGSTQAAFRLGVERGRTAGVDDRRLRH